MGQGGRPRGGGAAKRCKITEEGPKQLARRARGEREEISRVAGVWRSALEGSGRGRGRRHQRAAAARVAGGLQEAIQRELHEARLGGLLLLRGLPLLLPLPPAQPQAGEPPPAVIHGFHRCQADHTPDASVHAGGAAEPARHQRGWGGPGAALAQLPPRARPPAGRPRHGQRCSPRSGAGGRGAGRLRRRGTARRHAAAQRWVAHRTPAARRFPSCRSPRAGATTAAGQPTALPGEAAEGGGEGEGEGGEGEGHRRRAQQTAQGTWRRARQQPQS